jgi:hypothetical protein
MPQQGETLEGALTARGGVAGGLLRLLPAGAEPTVGGAPPLGGPALGSPLLGALCRRPGVKLPGGRRPGVKKVSIVLRVGLSGPLCISHMFARISFPVILKEAGRLQSSNLVKFDHGVPFAVALKARSNNSPRNNLKRIEPVSCAEGESSQRLAAISWESSSLIRHELVFKESKLPALRVTHK